MSVSVKDFIFCDDIRTELGNKFSLMGIYGDRIVLTPNDPAQKEFRLPLSSFIRFQGSLASEKEYTFSIVIDFEGQSVAEIKGTFSFHKRGIIAVPVQKIEFSVSQTGTLKFALEVFDKENRILDHSADLQIILAHLGKQPS